MAFFDFLNDFNSESKALKSAGNSFMSFLGGTGKTTVRQQLNAQTQQAVKTQPNAPFTQTLQRANQAPLNKSPFPGVSQIVGGVAGLAREATTKIAGGVAKTIEDRSQTMATGALSRQVADLRKLTYEQRKQALRDNPALGVLGGGVLKDPTDANLDSAIGNRQKAQQVAATPYQPKGALQKAVLGNEPISSYQERNKGLAQAGTKAGLGPLAGPLAFAGTTLNAGLDLIPGGSEGKGGIRALYEGAAKAKTLQEVEKLLGKAKLNLPDVVKNALVKTKDPGVAEKLIKDAINPTPLNPTRSYNRTAEGRLIPERPQVPSEIIPPNQLNAGPPVIPPQVGKIQIDKLPNGGYRALDTSSDTGYGLQRRATGKTEAEARANLAKLDSQAPQVGKTPNQTGGINIPDNVPTIKNVFGKEVPNPNYKAPEVPLKKEKVLEAPKPVRNLSDSSLPNSTTAPQVGKTVGKTTQDPLIKEWADVIKQQESHSRGGQMVPDGAGGYKRTTEHSQFYSKNYKENGRPPTNADWYAEAEKQVKTGKADPDFMKYYNEQNDPELKALFASQERATAPGSLGDTVVDTSRGPSPIPEPTGTRQYGTYASAQRATGLSDATKKGISEITPQTHDIRSTKELADRTRAEIATNPEAARNKLYTLGENGYKTEEDKIAASNLLMEHYSKLGTVEGTNKSVKIAEDLAQNNLGLGRAIQANRVIEHLSPAGATKFAESQIRHAREARNPEVLGKVNDVSKGIQGELEKTVNVKQKDIRKVVEDVAKGDPSAEKTVGEKVATRVGNVIDPQKKKQADALVEELTKKIKQESLAPKTLERKKPIELLREVFKRGGEAEQAYPEAQQILFERFKDNPNAMKALDKFFQSELKIPAAGSTIDRSIRDQLAENSKKISGIISESWAQQKRSVDDVAKALVKEGFDETSAKTLAKEVTDRLEAQVKDSKIKTLERMSKGTSESVKANYADKIAKLSNLGALDNQDYIDLARGKLKLPHLTTSTATEISKIAQKLQDTTDPAEKYLLAQDIGKAIQKDIPMTKKEIAGQVAGAPRALLASTDISGMGRQGILLGAAHPKVWLKSFKEQVKDFKNPEYFKKSMAAIASDPLYKKMIDSGLALTGVSKKPEEMFTSTILEGDLAKKFGIGHVLEASDNGYTGGLTYMRYSAFKNFLDKQPDGGKAILDNPQWLEGLSHYINNSTGRGGKMGGYLDKHADTLSQALFSPRLWASRLNVFNPKYYYDLKGPARREAYKDAAKFASVAAGVLTLATMAGAKVETDARSSDFLKIRVGDTRYDILGGFQQNLVFAWREISGEKKSSSSGEVTKLGSQFGGSDRFSILTDLIQNKENPVVATASRLIKGKDRGGNPTNIGKEALGLVVPLTIQEIGSGISHYGVAKGIASAVPGFLGVGNQTYGTKDINVTKKQIEYLDNLKKKNVAPEEISATKEFFQTFKTTPPQTKTMDKIKEAIKNNDKAEVKRLADDYNKKYVDSFKGWKEKYATKYARKDLIDYFQAGKIDGVSIGRAASKIKKDEANKKKGIVKL